jgi:hypothetical protein
MPILLRDYDKQRSGRRYKVHFRVRWGHGAVEEYEGQITDLSIGGCFIESEEPVEDNDPVKLILKVPGRGELKIWGHVVFRAAGTGFGVQFTAFAQDGTRDKLERILLEMSRHS